MSRRRTLHPDEEELWYSVAKTTRAMHKTGERRIPSAPPKEPSPTLLQPTLPRVPFFQLGEKSKPQRGHSIAPTVSEALAHAPVQMDAKAFGKMTRGKLAPEARIDLHGMTLAEAHPELIRFILNAQSDGLRLVLVITGKGKRGTDTGPIPQRIGALRHQVPQWLRMAPMGQAILQVAEAHLRHGGSGAFYVYLRKR